ncbi:MAG: nucleotidyltransferase [Calditrichaeota bacterium]|nr:MAG: nucleotidyltransferase [Calditrichota bacterium]
MNRKLIQQNKAEIFKIAKDFGAIEIKLFGSVAKGCDTENSDLDFLVTLEEGRSLFDLGGMQVELEELLGKKVDVITKNGLRKRIQQQVLEEASEL